MATDSIVVFPEHDQFTASPQMKQFFELVREVARYDTNVLVRGEAGLETVAEALTAVLVRD